MTRQRLGKPEQADQQVAMRMTAADRIEHVRRGLAAGKSQRAIARELGCDEGTVRRDIKKLRLPASALALIQQGAPAEPFLYTVRRQKTLEELRGRVEEEAANECHSDAAAQAGLTYLQQKALFRADEVLIMDMVGRKLWPLGDIVASPRRNSSRTFAHLDRDPLPADMLERIEHFVAVLMQGLWQIAPEKLIRERAIDKMTKAVADPLRRPLPVRPWGYREYRFGRAPQESGRTDHTWRARIPSQPEH